MRLFIIVGFFFCFVQNTFAQFGAGTKLTKGVQGTELIVVLDPVYGDAYNDAIQEAVEKYWTFTPKFRFISGPQFKQFCKDPKYSFLMRFEMKDATLTEEAYINLGIINGGKACKQAIEDWTAYANINIFNDGSYKTECIRAVQMMQNYLQLSSKNNISSLKNYEETYAIYNKSKVELEKKQIILQLDECLEEFQDLQKIRTYYPQKLKFVAFEALNAATLKQNPDLVYHVLARDTEGYRYHLFVQAKDSKILFANEAKRKDRCLIGKETLKIMADGLAKP